MNIDWDKLNEGFNEELQKNAFSLWPFAKKVAPVVGTGVGIAAGAHGLKNYVGGAFGDFAEAAKAIAPIGLATLLGATTTSSKPPSNPNVSYLPSHQKPSYLTPDPGTVSAISSPRPYASPIKQASIVDSFEDAVNRRIANSVLNQVTKTNALGFSIAPEDKPIVEKHPKEVELTSKYPELDELLKDERNKSYLKKLLSQ
jgi:hypothetical protein